jgi:sugar phosphate isomerase/epimerase
MPLLHRLSLQLYSARNDGPLDRQLRIAAEAGFTNVEPYPSLYDDLDGLATGLVTHGLSAASGHFALAAMEAHPDRVAAIAHRLGMETVIIAWLGPEDRASDSAGWRRMGGRLARIAARMREAGLALAWHNHAFEFEPLADGPRPIEILAEDPSLVFELDLAWIARAGEDPAPWLDRFAGRLAGIHVKDIARPGEALDEDGWADVGTGILPWTALWPKALAAGARLAVAEHDRPADFGRFARRSAAAMRAFPDAA